MNSRGFSLLELLVAIAIVGVLAALVAFVVPKMMQTGSRADTMAKLRQIGSAAIAYSSENDGSLPRRIEASGNEEQPSKWPELLEPYLQDPNVYARKADPQNFIRTGRNPLSNSRNRTSFIMNGWNDAESESGIDDIEVRFGTLEQPSRTILFGVPRTGSTHFYMDFAEGNHLDVIDLTSEGNGSPYLFADGSCRFIAEAEYLSEDRQGDDLWLVAKSSDYEIPTN